MSRPRIATPTRPQGGGVLHALCASLTLASAPGLGYAQNTEIEAALVHPPVAARFQCSEHALGAEDHVPDALGADCVVIPTGWSSSSV